MQIVEKIMRLLFYHRAIDYCGKSGSTEKSNQLLHNTHRAIYMYCVNYVITYYDFSD
jgi:hypothetical protein